MMRTLTLRIPALWAEVSRFKELDPVGLPKARVNERPKIGDCGIQEARQWGHRKDRDTLIVRVLQVGPLSAGVSQPVIVNNGG